MADPKSVLEFVKKNNVKLLDLRFTDLPGLWHHVSYPIDQFSESSFDNVRFDQREQHGFYFIDAEEGRWNSGRQENNLGYRPRYKEGYFPVPPTDHYQDLRSEMVMTMQSCGLEVECHHHEVATGGQTEIDLKFDSLVKSADHMMLYKYIVKNVANQYGKTV